MGSYIRIGVTVGALALGLAVAGCDSFDPTDIFDSEIFNTKKKLPGDRQPVFPEGTPGVPQGVPPDLVKGYQPPPEPEPVKEAEPVEPKANPKPKPKVVAKPKDESKPTAVTVRPSQEQAQSEAQSQPPAQSQSQAQWPDPPPMRQHPVGEGG